MDLATQRLMSGAAGAGGDPVYVDDVFSTFLYEGNNSDQTITTNLDFATEGGLTWIKNRSLSGKEHVLVDTVRGTGKTIFSSHESGTDTYNATTKNISSFTSTGFTLKSDDGNDWFNGNGSDYSSWNFRKAKGFFDVVKFTAANSSNQRVAHSLGCVPGLILLKNIDANQSWFVYHSDTGKDKYLKLNSSDATDTISDLWGPSGPTSTDFGFKSNSYFTSGDEIIAYLFADGDESAAQIFGENSDKSIIKMGTYTGNGSNNGPTVNLGWEPSYVLIKQTTQASNWRLHDSMRGIVTGGDDAMLRPDTNQAEVDSGKDRLELQPTGFKLTNSDTDMNQNGATYAYMCIRRPDGSVGKPPELGNQVFTPVFGSANAPMFKSNNHIVDFTLQKNSNFATQNKDWNVTARLMSGFKLASNTNGVETANGYQVFDYQHGMSSYGLGSGIRFAWLWKRYAGMDVVTYTGNSQYGRTVQHSLGKIPEMIWIKCRGSATEDWVVGHKGLNGGTNPWEYALRLNNTNAETDYPYFADTAPTSTLFTLNNNGQVNGHSSNDYLAMLFASTVVSKVGSYTGTGNALSVTTGFQPRFLMIKNASTSTGDSHWWTVDTVRGWGSGDDNCLRIDTDNTPTLGLNLGAPTSTGFDMPANSGNSTAYNKSGDTYIYYCHA